MENNIASGNIQNPNGATGNNGGGLGGLSMLMMGGGIGIAAIGSAAAFMARTLSNVSIWAILSVILGIILVFGGPSVVIALIKLYCRDLGRFLEASGNAVNRPMRLSGKLGRVFTWEPPLPGKVRHGKKAKIFFLITLIILIVAAATFGICRYRQTKCCQATTAPAVEQTEKSGAQVEKDAEKPLDATAKVADVSDQKNIDPEPDKIKK